MKHGGGVAPLSLHPPRRTLRPTRANTKVLWAAAQERGRSPGLEADDDWLLENPLVVPKRPKRSLLAPLVSELGEALHQNGMSSSSVRQSMTSSVTGAGGAGSFSTGAAVT